MHEEVKNVWLSSFALVSGQSLVGIFVPIYLLELGFSLQQVLLYLVLVFLTNLACVPLVRKIQADVGVKRVMLAGSFFIVLFYASLMLFQFGFPLVAVAALAGAGPVLYWSQANFLFASFSLSKRMGADSAVWGAANGAAMIVAPLLGTAVLLSFGFSVLFSLGCVFVFLSGLLMFRTKDYKFPVFADWKKVLAKKNYFAMWAAEGASFGAWILWPLFIFSNAPQYAPVGIAAFAIAVTSILADVSTGVLVDKFSRRKILKAGMLVATVMMLAIVFVVPPGWYFEASLLFGVAGSFVITPVFVITCSKAQKHGVTRWMPARSVAGICGQLLVVCAALAFPAAPFAAGFATAAVLSAAVLFFKFEE